MSEHKTFKDKFDDTCNFKSISIQGLMLISFTVVSAVIVFVLGIIFYKFFSIQSAQTIIQSTKQVTSQTTTNLEDYLQQMRQLSDTLYYNSIKEIDISNATCETEMNMLYEANKDKLISFALFSEDGKLIAASPNADLKDDVDVKTDFRCELIA